VKDHETPMRVALFCGSTSPGGANRAALTAVASMLDLHGMVCIEAGDVASIPAFRAEEVDAAPSSVESMRAGFESVDAVVLAIPEFGGGAAGAAKNALDWMVGSGSLYERPCGVMSAGTTGEPNSIHQIARTLAWQGAFVIETLNIATPWSTRNEKGDFTDVKTLTALEKFAAEIAGVRGTAKETLEMTSAQKLRSLGIDPVNRSGR
jgi:chromate reductase, NAD(P)H dehydrogenase (quinone)